ncbi:hypothetical protein [Actinomadura hibisca]|uniref:hypothetical protein n=1 Tax=Actinomadura hibisca TaxID=68565 RepID=UPI000830B8A9|nr:hypothetical protein [Actinomadura hibisca]
MPKYDRITATAAVAADWPKAARLLVAELQKYGLTATTRSHAAVAARNPAGEPDPNDLLGAQMAPGLRQEVLCRPHGDGTLWWFWAWSGPERGSPPDLEPLCPVSEAERAADAIAKVLAVPYADLDQG